MTGRLKDTLKKETKLNWDRECIKKNYLQVETEERVTERVDVIHKTEVHFMGKSRMRCDVKFETRKETRESL